MYYKNVNTFQKNVQNTFPKKFKHLRGKCDVLIIYKLNSYYIMVNNLTQTKDTTGSSFRRDLFSCLILDFSCKSPVNP